MWEVTRDTAEAKANSTKINVLKNEYRAYAYSVRLVRTASVSVEASNEWCGAQPAR